MLMPILLAACSQVQEEAGQPEAAVREPLDYGESRDVWEVTRKELAALAQENPQGIGVKTDLSARARKALATVTPGDVPGYYATITDENYAGDSASEVIAVLSAAELVALSKARGYVGAGIQEDDVIMLSLAKRDGGDVAQDMYLSYSMPDVIFINTQVGSRQQYLRCALRDAALWKKLHHALVEL